MRTWYIGLPAARSRTSPRIYVGSADSDTPEGARADDTAAINLTWWPVDAIHAHEGASLLPFRRFVFGALALRVDVPDDLLVRRAPHSPMHECDVGSVDRAVVDEAHRVVVLGRETAEVALGIERPGPLSRSELWCR